MPVNLRPLTPDDASTLWDFVRIAAHVDSIEEVKSNPDLSRYVTGIDQEGDQAGVIGVLAEQNEKPVGAAWVRLWNNPQSYGYGFVQEDVPELAIGVLPDNQGEGIGLALIDRLLQDVAAKGIVGISLSVLKTNAAALKLYKRFGFESVPGTEGDSSLSMIHMFDETAVVLRDATAEDIPTLLSLLRKKADFDATMADTTTCFTVTTEKLQANLFEKNRPFEKSMPPRARVLLAAQQQAPIVGMAIFYFRFSSFAGQPSIWLEDLFISNDFRSQGTGQKIMNQLKWIAVSEGCTHIGWSASVRNTRGLAFYKRLGAEIVNQQGNECTFKWTMGATSTQ